MATSVNVATANSDVMRVSLGSGDSVGGNIVVAGVGDLNGDGLADIAVGLPGATYTYVDEFLHGGDGAVYVIFGDTNLPTDPSLAGLDTMLVPGSLDFEQLGAAVASLGDVNGDGLDDLLVTAPGAYANANTYPGGTFKNYDDPAAGYVIYGDGTPPAQLPTSTLDAALTGKSIASEPSYTAYDTKGLGTTAAGLGDIDGDGLGDFALARPQGYVQTYVGAGGYANGDSVSRATLVVASSGGSFWIDRSGEAASTDHVAAAGDVNNDGKDDFIVGNKLIFGQGNTTFSDVTFAGLGSDFAKITTLASGTTGTTVRGAGDINGDGFDDLVGVSGASAKLTYGAANGVESTKTLSLPSGLTKIVFAGAAGDVDGDNVDDLLVVGSKSDGSGAKAFVIFGHTGGLGSVSLGSLADKGLTIDGFGSAILQSAASAGDVDNDGHDDLVFGLRNPTSGALTATVVLGSAVEASDNTGDAGGGGSGGGSGSGDSGGSGSQDDAGGGTAGSDTLTGTASAETMSGAGGDDTLRGGGGGDWLDGGDGNDWLDGGADSDVIVAGAGNDWGEPSDGNDSMWGQDGNDTLNGGDGDDRLFGNGDDDQLFGGAGDDQGKGHLGDDTLMGEAGSDTLYGGAVNDSIDGGADNDTVNGNSGADTVSGGDGDDVVRGQGGPDSLFGGDGNDLLLGMAGFDTLFGGDGKDTLVGGDANDQLTGGADADVFSFGPGQGSDVVTDFQDGIDKLSIAGVSGFADLTITDVAGDAHIVIAGDNAALPLEITLNDIIANQLSAADFIFS